MTPSQPAPESPGPMLPVWVMIFSVAGLCFPPLLLVTGALGLYGYLRGKKDAEWAKRKQVTQMTMAVSGAGLLIFVGLFLPNFKNAQLRMKQLECRDTLTSLYAAEARLYEKEKRYTSKVSELDWKPPRGRHLIRLGEGPLEEVGQGFDEAKFPAMSSKAVDEAIPKLVSGTLGVHGECPACSVTILCATQLDSDATADVWTVSTIERTGSQGEKIAGGLPWCDVDDVAL